MLIESDREVKRMQDRVLEEMNHQTSDLQADLHFWYQKNFQAIKLLATMANGSLAGDLAGLQRDTEVLQKAFPDFHGIWLTDSQGTAVAFFPTMDERGEKIVNPNFADRPYFKKLKATQQPVMSEVFVGRGAVFTPLVTLSTPIVVEGRFKAAPLAV